MLKTLPRLRTGLTWLWLRQQSSSQPLTTVADLMKKKSEEKIQKGDEDIELLKKRKHSLVAWGFNSDGQLGMEETTEDEYEPHVISLPPSLRYETLKKIECGAAHTACLTDAGDVAIWGNNYYMCVGEFSNKPLRSMVAALFNDVESTPVHIRHFASPFKDIALGLWHTVALLQDGTLWSWGNNTANQLGIDDGVNYALPERLLVKGDSAPVAVSAGGLHTLVLDEQGQVHQFGSLPKPPAARLAGLTSSATLAGGIRVDDGHGIVWGHELRIRPTEEIFGPYDLEQAQKQSNLVSVETPGPVQHLATGWQSYAWVDREGVLWWRRFGSETQRIAENVKTCAVSPLAFQLSYISDDRCFIFDDVRDQPVELSAKCHTVRLGFQYGFVIASEDL